MQSKNLCTLEITDQVHATKEQQFRERVVGPLLGVVELGNI